MYFIDPLLFSYVTVFTLDIDLYVFYIQATSFDVYRKEVLSGAMAWSPVHADDGFWRESIGRFEESNCQVQYGIRVRV